MYYKTVLCLETIKIVNASNLCFLFDYIRNVYEVVLFLELDHFLEEQFPGEYRERRDAIELKQIQVKLETPSCMYIYCIQFYYIIDII